MNRWDTVSHAATTTFVYGPGVGYYGRAADDRHRSIRTLGDGRAMLTVTAPGSWDVEVSRVFPSVRAAKRAAAC